MNNNENPCLTCSAFCNGCDFDMPVSTCPFHPNYVEPVEDTPYNMDFLSTCDNSDGIRAMRGDF